MDPGAHLFKVKLEEEERKTRSRNSSFASHKSAHEEHHEQPMQRRNSTCADGTHPGGQGLGMSWDKQEAFKKDEASDVTAHDRHEANEHQFQSHHENDKERHNSNPSEGTHPAGKGLGMKWDKQEAFDKDEASDPTARDRHEAIEHQKHAHHENDKERHNANPSEGTHPAGKGLGMKWDKQEAFKKDEASDAAAPARHEALEHQKHAHHENDQERHNSNPNAGTHPAGKGLGMKWDRQESFNKDEAKAHEVAAAHEAHHLRREGSTTAGEGTHPAGKGLGMDWDKQKAFEADAAEKKE